MRVLIEASRPTIARRLPPGYTLIELLVAIVIFGLVAGGVMNAIISAQRSSIAQSQRIDLQQNLRAAAVVLPAELRSLDAVDGDIQAMAANSITIRAMRQLAIICTPPVMGAALTGRLITVRTPLYSSARNFQAGDSVLIWYEGDAMARSDDGWLLGRVTAVAAQNCTDGTAGQRLTTDIQAPVLPKLNKIGAIPNGAPLRGFEIVTYSAGVAADGRWYLNLQDTNGTTPLLGPLNGSAGLAFTYYNAAGAVTAVPTQVAQIGLTVRGQTVDRINKGATSGFAADSLVTTVTLRNNPRF
jgi:prepilin-type N-terminal cleavage/methylation domain-containing protein